MKKILILLFISSLTLFASVGKITALKGEVYIKRNGALNFARVGAKLELKDKVVTKEKSKALLLFNDQTSITVGKNASMAVEKFVFDTNVASNNQANFRFGQGVFRTITGKIGKLNKRKFQIKTSTASIGIRGTVFDVVVNDKGVPDVGVLYGAIALSFDSNMKKEFTDQEIVVSKGQSVIFDPQATQGEKFIVQDKPLPQTENMNKDFKALSSEQEKNTKTQNNDKQDKKDDKVNEEKKKKNKNDVAAKEEKKEDKSNDAKNNQKKESKKIIIDKKDDEKKELKNNQEKEQSKENISNSNENKNKIQQDSTVDNTEKQNNEVVQTEEKNQPTEPKQPIETEQNNEIIQTKQTQTIEHNPEPIATPTNISEKTTIEGFDDIEQSTLETDIQTTTIAIDAPKNTQHETETNTQTQMVETQDVEQPVIQAPDTQHITNVINKVSETTEESVSQQEEQLNISPVINGPNIVNLDEDTYTSFTISASDEDNIQLTYSIVSEPTHGEAIINESTGEVTYTPNPDYSGIENITISVSDGYNIITSDITLIIKDIVEPIDPSTPSSSLPDLSTDIEAITNKIMNENSDRYMEFGFIGIDNDNDYLPDDPLSEALYLTGDITPSEVIENYISTSQTASYRGGVSALIDGVASKGTVNLDVNFGTQNFTGNINITQGNWEANINSGGITPYRFNSTDISGSSDYGSIIDGAVDGKFYGPSANSVGGSFNLSTSTKSANGVFGGGQQ